MNHKTALEETVENSRRNRVHRHRMVDGVMKFERGNVPTTAEAAAAVQHDLLLIPSASLVERDQFFRFPVEKATVEDKAGDPGHYVAPPELLDAYDYSQRAVLSVACPQEWGPEVFADDERGPVFVTLPVKPEPVAAALGICYLINTRNLNFRNAWTAEEWIDLPGGADLEPAPGADAHRFEALLAGPRGQVFRVHFQGLDAWTPGAKAVASPDKDSRATCRVECVDLETQSEIWSQLRNGTVIGRVLYRTKDKGRVVPLVNITSLTPLTKRTPSISDVDELEGDAK